MKNRFKKVATGRWERTMSGCWVESGFDIWSLHCGQSCACWLARCRVGENWWYRGEHCEEYVSEPLVVGIAIASVAGFLLVASGVIFFLARTLRDQYDKDESEDPIRWGEPVPSFEPGNRIVPMHLMAPCASCLSDEDKWCWAAQRLAILSAVGI